MSSSKNEEVVAATFHTNDNESNKSNNKDDNNKNEEAFESLAKSMSSPKLRPFVIISSSYLLYTITDGAIRMIVLLHAYNKSFSALEVSIMFMLYVSHFRVIVFL